MENYAKIWKTKLKVEEIWRKYEILSMVNVINHLMLPNL